LVAFLVTLTAGGVAAGFDFIPVSARRDDGPLTHIREMLPEGFDRNVSFAIGTPWS